MNTMATKISNIYRKFHQLRNKQNYTFLITSIVLASICFALLLIAFIYPLAVSADKALVGFVSTTLTFIIVYIISSYVMSVFFHIMSKMLPDFDNDNFPKTNKYLTIATAIIFIFFFTIGIAEPILSINFKLSFGLWSSFLFIEYCLIQGLTIYFIHLARRRLQGESEFNAFYNGFNSIMLVVLNLFVLIWYLVNFPFSAFVYNGNKTSWIVGISLLTSLFIIIWYVARVLIAYFYIKKILNMQLSKKWEAILIYSPFWFTYH
ncbi:hypothetical protein [Mycoplasmopsis adleri]|uniref:hypothetical protein n=1 Tax=Mycoplasmopsis adleri TaxID=51362 RepID=UPI003872BF4F